MPPEISRSSTAIAATALTLMVLGCFTPFIWKVVIPLWVTGSAPADWTWPKVWGALCVMTAIFLYLGYGVFLRFNTTLTDAEILVPAHRGVRRLRWEQVESIRVQGHELILQGAPGAIKVNTLCFKRPRDVEAFIRARLSSVQGQRELQR